MVGNGPHTPQSWTDGQTDGWTGMYTSPTGEACSQPGHWEPTGKTQSSLDFEHFLKSPALCSAYF